MNTDAACGGPADETQPNTCPHCRALAAKVAELERRLEERGDEREPLMLKAMRISTDPWSVGWGLRPSPPRRHWMDQAPAAYQCLPLVVANQWGWQILSPTDVVVTWDGSPRREGLTVQVDARFREVIHSQFGSGIVTFSTPWLFRTSPGWNLYLKGPGNRWKPNCVPLEGVVETWWLNYPFTLNWKLVEPGTITFARGESLGQLVPVPHATFRDAAAVEVPVDVDPASAAELLRWHEARRERAQTPVTTHRLYRKAEGIEEHLAKVAVPGFVSDWPKSPDGD